MSVKEKGYEIIQHMQTMFALTETEKATILMAFIKNGTIHADEVYNATQLIDAYEKVMGEFHPTECDCVDCCDHPTCGTTGVCVNHCDECNGDCEVLV